MKKFIVLMLSAVMCVTFFACAKNNDEVKETESSSALDLTSQTERTTQPSTVSLPETSTTAKPNKQKKKAKKVEKQVKEYFSAKDKEVDGKKNGGFEYKQENPDPVEMYAQEYSDDALEKAEKNAADFVDSIRENYPDGDKIKHYTTQIKQVGTGDNGVDSVTYLVIYINSQNQELNIHADSNGEIFYVDCKFTW